MEKQNSVYLVDIKVIAHKLNGDFFSRCLVLRKTNHGIFSPKRVPGPNDFFHLVGSNDYLSGH